MSAPFIISSMTGGCEEGGKINKILAQAAQAMGLAMGVGSQRVALMDGSLASTYQVRDVAPDIMLFANIGAVQLNNGFYLDECRAAVEMIEADALVLHLNPLQESVQSGGNTNFAGLASKIEMICHNLDVPVVVKEVGQGISERTARILREAGVAGIDTAGAGGTSWAQVESLRNGNDKSGVGRTFSNWGIPTAESVMMCRKEAPDLLIIGSGGIRSGVDAAKVLALGADIAGFALPLLRAAVLGFDAVIERLKQYREELKTAMFCVGARSIEELQKTSTLRKGHPGQPVGRL
jgi:isopentenyl-diphosphate delta-isomerase